MFRKLLYYMTVIGPIRDYIRIQALKSFQTELESLKRDLVLPDPKAKAPDDFYLRKKFVPNFMEPLNVLDETFKEPVEFTCMLDLRKLGHPDTARVAWFIGIRGEEKDDLVQVAGNVYEAPAETGEAILIGPITVSGRVVVTYRLLSGDDDALAPVHVLAFASPVFRSKVDA